MVWRRVLVRSDSTIADLHNVLQIAFGWSDDHLHCFRIHGKEYGIPHVGGMGFDDDATTVRLACFRFRTCELSTRKKEHDHEAHTPRDDQY